MLSSGKWIYSVASAARDLRLAAVARCLEGLPTPHNYAAHRGRKVLVARLELELSEFDFRYRQVWRKPANLEQLACIATLLLESTGGAVPRHALPLDDELLINRYSFPLLVRWMEERLRNSTDPTTVSQETQSETKDFERDP